MTGILHDYAVEGALNILGPGASKTGFRKQLKKWFCRSLDINGALLCCEDCSQYDGRNICKDCLDLTMLEEMPDARPVPDAFKIHRNHPRVGRGAHRKQYFIIDVIEIDGSSTLAKKINTWINFGWRIDCSDYAFLRLRLYNEHLNFIGEYNEEDFMIMSVMDNAKYQSCARAAV